MVTINAYKMDGLGNDFIIFDQRKKSVSLTKEEIIKISDRNNIGCDQVIFIENDKNNDVFLKFYNSDGGEISACGNGSRCVAYLLMMENNNKKISLGTKGGLLQAELNEKNLVCINLEIKISDLDEAEITGGFSLNVGNPHVVFFVKDLNRFDLNEIGPKIENYNYFPEKCNVTLASIKSRNLVKVKVWERGAGLTKACGTAACATAVSGSILKLNERCVDIEFAEGLLNIDWKKDNNIYMTGKVSEVKKIIVNI